MPKTFEVRDMRSKSKFFVDDEYLNGYAKLCGPNATMVYLCLCRHSDRHQESFPSIETMASKTGISPRSVIRGIGELIKWNIVSKERERRSDAKWLNNRYVLLDKSVWLNKPSATQSHGNAEPHAKSSKSHMPHSHTKDTHVEKDTHNTENKFSTFGGKSLTTDEEYEIVSDSPQKERKERKDKGALALREKLYTLFEKETGVRPTTHVADYLRVFEAMKRMKEKEILELVEEGIDSGKKRTVREALTAREIDIYLQDNS